MNNEIVMVFAHGFVFVGKVVIGLTGLKDAVRLDTVNAMDAQGRLMPITVMNKIGDLENISHYPYTSINNKSDLYRDYIKLITGIEIAKNQSFQ